MERLEDSSRRKNDVEYLVDLKFPHLRDPPTIMTLARMGGFEGVEAAEAYRQELEGLADGAIASLAAEARQREAERDRARAEEVDAERPHSQPNAKGPDYDLWTKHAYWTVDEMVALALARDPAVVSWSLVKRELDRGSAFAKRYATLREIVGRAVATGQLNRTTGPLEFMEWADRLRVELPRGLSTAIKALQARGVGEDGASGDGKGIQQAQADQVGDLKSTIGELTEKNRILTARVEELEAAHTSLGPRERESLLRIVLAVAIKKYGYDVNASKTPTVTNLARTLDEQNLSLHPDTIRSYLQEARSLLKDRLPH